MAPSRGPRRAHPSVPRAAFGSVLGGVAGGLLLASCAPSLPPHPRAAGSAPAVMASHDSPDAAATTLWARTLRASREAPVQARVVITRWRERSARGRKAVFDVVEGRGGRYRHTYTAPDSERGRQVVSDGETVWQYEPQTHVVLRHPAPSNDSPLGDSSPRTDTCNCMTEPGSEIIAGRPTQKLVVRGRDGRIMERRWIDRETGRSLRTEKYAASGHILRRVEMTQVSFFPQIAPDTFRPSFPRSARVLNAAAERVSNTTAEARRLKLPTRAKGFSLRSVVRPHSNAAKLTSQSTHLLYSNGYRAVSVFVTEGASADKEAVLRPSGRWQSVSLGEGRQGYAQEGGRGRAAVAWVGSRSRYVAVARLPLADLLSVARSLSIPDSEGAN